MALKATRRLAGAVAVLALIVLSGCREEVSDTRVYEPGVYKGKKDQEISEEARKNLSKRVKRQGFN